jgi:putative peptide zinc metalloprotease protein
MEAADTPKRRADLVLTPAAEGAFITVHDPRSGRYFRIREVEGFILSLLDGVTPLPEVHAAVLREFPGVRLALNTVLSFGDRLAQLGWLEGSEPGKRRRPPLYRRLARMQTPPIPADGLFLLVQPMVRVLYHPLSLLAILAATLAAGYWAFFSMEEFWRYTPRLTTPGGLALLFCGFTLMAVCHEMGHGATCRYFGARSNGVGLFFLYGIPCFYCDVSGAWTLSSRRQRLLIGIAGLAWQFVAGALAFVCWKALEPHTLAARVCHVMVGMCGVTALINLNPFIKLDGYYLLSDWWGIPNLRSKALAYFRGRLAAFLLGTPAPKGGEPRHRGRLFWFGLMCACSTPVLVSLVVLKFSGWLLRTAQGTGAILLGVVAMAILGSWLRNLWNSRREALRAKRGEPEPGEGPVGPGSPRPARTRVPIPFGLLLVLAAVAGGMYWFWNAKWTLFVASPCTLEAEERVAVRPPIEGVLQEIRCQEGEAVKAGSTLAVLETYDLRKSREQLQERVEVVAAAGDVVEQQVPLVAAEKERDVAEAEQHVRQARAELEDRQELYPIRRAEAERRVQEARAALDTAELAADRTRGDERAVADGRLVPSMQAIADRIERVRVQRDLAQKEMKRTAYLVSEGALQRQKLDVATTELLTLEKEEASLQSELLALRKNLIERREDAEAQVRERRAAYDAALEAQRLVGQETRPQRLDTVREEVATRAAILDATQALRKATQVKRAEAAAKKLEARPLATEMERVEKKIRQARVTAPISGVISTPRLTEKIGRKFEKGETIAWIDRVETLTARIFVDEKEIGEVRKGLPVQLRVGAYPDRLFEGKVLEVSPRAGNSNGRGAYEVRLRIQNPHGDLRPGITGYAKLISGERPLREVAFRRLHRYIRTEVWTWF